MLLVIFSTHQHHRPGDGLSRWMVLLSMRIHNLNVSWMSQQTINGTYKETVTGKVSAHANISGSIWFLPLFFILKRNLIRSTWSTTTLSGTELPNSNFPALVLLKTVFKISWWKLYSALCSRFTTDETFYRLIVISIANIEMISIL